jgi:hypothetical protein
VFLEGLGIQKDIRRLADLQSCLRCIVDAEKLTGQALHPYLRTQSIMDRLKREWSDLKVWEEVPDYWIVAALTRCIETVSLGGNLLDAVVTEKGGSSLSKPVLPGGQRPSDSSDEPHGKQDVGRAKQQHPLVNSPDDGNKDFESKEHDGEHLLNYHHQGSGSAPFRPSNPGIDQAHHGPVLNAQTSSCITIPQGFQDFSSSAPGGQSCHQSEAQFPGSNEGINFDQNFSAPRSRLGNTFSGLGRGVAIQTASYAQLEHGQQGKGQGCVLNRFFGRCG